MALFTSEAQARFYWRGRLVRYDDFYENNRFVWEPLFLFSLLFLFSRKHRIFRSDIYIYIYSSLSLSLIELLLSLRSRYINIVVSLTRVEADSIKSELNSIDVSIRLGCAASFFLRIKKKGRGRGGREGKGKERERTTSLGVRERRLDSPLVVFTVQLILLERRRGFPPSEEGARLPWIRVQPLNAIKRRNGMARHPGQVH